MLHFLLFLFTHQSSYAEVNRVGNWGGVLLSTLLDWAVMLSREHGGLKEGEAFSTLNPATHVLRDVSLGLEVREVGLFWLYMDK